MSPIIEVIIQIKNGYMSGKETIQSSYSKYRVALLEKLKTVGYIKSYDVEGDIVKTISIDLLYNDSVPVVNDVKIFSKPGRRWYVSVKELKPVLGGLGNAFISTPKGILTNKEAKKVGVGGELLFHIW